MRVDERHQYLHYFSSDFPVVVVVDLPAFSSTTAKPVAPSTTGVPTTTTEFPPWTEADTTLPPNATALRNAGLRAGEDKCFRYVYGYFGGNVTVIGRLENEMTA